MALADEGNSDEIAQLSYNDEESIFYYKFELSDAVCQVHDADEVHKHVFFRVLSPYPSKMKGISYNSGVAEGFCDDELAICLLKPFHDSAGQLCLSEMNADASHGLQWHSVFTLPFLKHLDLRKCVCEWDVHRTKLALVDVPSTWLHQQQYAAIVDAMLKAKAFVRPNGVSLSYRCVSNVYKECLDMLKGAGFVSMVSTDNEATYWRFTQAGLRALVVVSTVVNPKSVLQIADGTPLDASLITLQLLDGILS